MEFVEHLLGEPMASAVESIFYLNNYNPEHAIERLVPDGLTSLVIELDGQERFVLDNDDRGRTVRCCGSWFSGLHRQYISFTALANTELIGVRFRPGRALSLVHGSIESWSNRVAPAVEVFGATINAVRSEALAADGPIAKLAIIEAWMLSRWSKDNDPPTELVAALEQIAAQPSLATLDGLHEHVGVSEKRLVALFKQHVGAAPKTFQRIVRFSEIVKRLGGQEDVNWAELSVECGYYDQSHLVRDFSHFSGFQPAEFLNRKDDRENFFPESE